MQNRAETAKTAILVVTDDLKFFGELKSVFDERGYAVTRAGDGVEGRDCFDLHSPDAVVTEARPAHLPAHALVRHIKSRNPYAVIVTLQGKGEGRHAIEAYRAGIFQNLKKPVDAPAVLASVEAGLSEAASVRSLEADSLVSIGFGGDERAELLFEAPIAILHLTDAGTIVFSNRKAGLLFGKKPEELSGEPLTSHVNPKFGENWFKAVVLGAKTPGGYDGEFSIRGGLGRMIQVRVTAIALRQGGGMAMCLRDLTREKLIESELLESKKLSALGHVVEGVAHEVRNPLLSIGGFARILSQGQKSGATEKKYLGIILDEVARLERMVRDIEEYALFAKKHPLPDESLDMALLLDQPAREAVKRWNEKHPPVSIELSLAGGMVVFGSQRLLAELFGELWQNALESMRSKGGSLKISLDEVGGWARIIISDTGVGIARDQLESIFDPFFTSKTHGVGLGLAKAHIIVEDHRGQIHFSSNIGEGTVCTVLIPLEQRKTKRDAIS